MNSKQNGKVMSTCQKWKNAAYCQINNLDDSVSRLIKNEKQRMSLREFSSLLWINLLVSIRNTKEFFKVVFNYYHHLTFLKEDLSLRLMYLFHNPYSISKRFLINKGEDNIYAYGETPLTSLEVIARECSIGANDCVYELGAGRGRTCFWLNSFLGCSVVGIEYNPEFVERANRIKHKLKLDHVEFRLEDFCKSDLQGATVIYLYGTCLEESTIKEMIKKFSKLPKGTKIITVSYPLTDYTDLQGFEVMKRFTVPFTWGETDVFLQVIK